MQKVTQMNVHLLLQNGDFDLSMPSPWDAEPLTSALSLVPLFQATASGDTVIGQSVRAVILRPLTNQDELLYRQEIVRTAWRSLS